ncbi:Hint domain-containing protein [Roseomonas sp. 18066]|uniref:Hint domain-containing protein n=1 Tax=Roseomonas sp. 18066 TaxID=2681412 RepID=UPI00135C7479|nr:Hint domain-containing protein [Roseomonas sp. 18066]
MSGNIGSTFQSLTYGEQQTSAYTVGTPDYAYRVTDLPDGGLKFLVVHVPPTPGGTQYQYTVTMTEPATNTVQIWEHAGGTSDWPGNYYNGQIGHHSAGAFTVNSHSGTQPVQWLFTNGPIGEGSVTVYPNDSPLAGSFVPTCYAAGSRILTTRGEVAVEALREGDRVLTLGGAEQPVVWIGHRRVDPARMPDPADFCAIRIRADAFGEGLPYRDLRLSPDHSVFVDGALVTIRQLVNGATILREPPAPVTYYHVELPAHAILLAEGLPAESYLDTGNRAAFSNGGPVVALHRMVAQQLWEAGACAPKLEEGPALQALRRRLIARARALGHATTTEAEPRLVLDGVAIAPLRQEEDALVFALPPGDWQAIRLRSRAGVPAWVEGSGDDRRLGLAVAELTLRGPQAELTIGAHAGILAEGFHGCEADGRHRWRWTNGEAHLPAALFAAFREGGELTVRLPLRMTYWLEAPREEIRQAG